MPTRFPEPDLDRLEQYLNDPGRADSTLPLDMVQGLFAATTSGPSVVPAERWLPEVLGEAHAFASPQEEAEITGLLQRFQSETARQLNEGEGFDFILYGAEGEPEELAAWTEGYLIGVDLSDPPWDVAADAEDLDSILFPFLALTGQAKELALEQGEEWMSDEDEAQMLDEIRTGFADHLIAVRRYWFEKGVPETVRRETPKVGRNDPCSCGSGKKYKNCCGA